MKHEMNEFEAAAHNVDTDSGWRQEVRSNRCASGFLDVEAEAEDGGGEMVKTQAGTVGCAGWERSCSTSACDEPLFERRNRGSDGAIIVAAVQASPALSDVRLGTTADRFVGCSVDTEPIASVSSARAMFERSATEPKGIARPKLQVRNASRRSGKAATFACGVQPQAVQLTALELVGLAARMQDTQCKLDGVNGVLKARRDAEEAARVQLLEQARAGVKGQVHLLDALGEADMDYFSRLEELLEAAAPNPLEQVILQHARLLRFESRRREEAALEAAQQVVAALAHPHHGHVSGAQCSIMGLVVAHAERMAQRQEEERLVELTATLVQQPALVAGEVAVEAAAVAAVEVEAGEREEQMEAAAQMVVKRKGKGIDSRCGPPLIWRHI